MNERHENEKGINWSRWLLWGFLAFIILFVLGYCSIFGTTFNDVKNRVKNPKQEHYQNGEENFQNDYEQNGRLDKEDTKFAFTVYPSGKYYVYKPETISQLAKRFGCSVQEIIIANPSLKPVNPSKPISPNTPVDKGDVIDVPSGSDLKGFEAEVVKLTNEERQKSGLKSLTSNNAQLNKSAHLKSSDMNDKNYFSHQSPTYGSPFEMMQQLGITYNYAAENIAQGQTTPEAVMSAWMNSSGHRANILNPNLTQIGVGFVKGNGKYYWTQQFIGK